MTINWKNGQRLLPEHFKASEASLMEVSLASELLQGRGGYGFAEMEINTSMLQAGVFQLSGLKLIDQDGRFYSLHENLSFQPCELDELPENLEKLSLHILPGVPKTIELNGQHIETAQYKAMLDGPFMDEALATLPCVRVSKKPNGQWDVLPQVKMPILSFRSNHFWRHYQGEIESLIACVEQRIRADQMSSLSPSKYIMSQNLVADCYKLKQHLNTIEAGGDASPRSLFQALYTFYVACVLYSGDDPATDLIYTHHNGVESLDKLIRAIGVMVRYEVKEHSVLAFRSDERYAKIDRLPREICASSRVYLLVQNTGGHPLNMMHQKIASQSRLPILHQKALPGLMLEKENAETFAHLFDGHTDVYRIRPGEEWDYIAKESTVAIRQSHEMQNSRLYLYSPDYVE